MKNHKGETLKIFTLKNSSGDLVYYVLCGCGGALSKLKNLACVCRSQILKNRQFGLKLGQGDGKMWEFTSKGGSASKNKQKNMGNDGFFCSFLVA